jgi:hypothetical protein
MSIDDILFEPINHDKDQSHIDQKLIDEVKIALTGISAKDLFVDRHVSLETYELIADLVENDPQIVKYTNQMVTPVSAMEKRPNGAMTIKEVFRRLHVGENNFYFSARANGLGITKGEFANRFVIDGKIPMLHIDPSNGGGVFEWWVMGLMTNNVGYNQYYCFANWSDASKYYGVP